jgi:hypothetical protein
MDPLATTGQSLTEFWETFPNEASCAAYLFERRWPDGFVCLCGGRHYSALKSRAYTYECRECRRHTSITANTVMHGSHLPLDKWFSAAYLLATHPGAVSVRQLQARLKIAYQTALEVKRKLLLTKIPEDYEPLQGAVEVDLAEIPFEAYSSVFHRALTDKFIAVIALEMRNDEAARATLSAVRGSNRLRVAVVQDNSLASIEPFIRANVTSGTRLVTGTVEPFFELMDHGYDVQDLDKALARGRQVFASLEDWFSACGPVHWDRLDEVLKDFVAELNWRVNFDRLLQVAAHHKPPTYWDMVGRDNPRKGNPTIRHNPRRRKTAAGMREDGSGPS